MSSLRRSSSVVLVCVVLSAGAGGLAAAEIRGLTAYPDTIALKGSQDARQLVLTATLTDDRDEDRTNAAVYKVADPKIARVNDHGRVFPIANGTTALVADSGGMTVSVPLVVADCDRDLPIDFASQIVPIFTKLGCNSGGCHGKQSGQNGFRLSLLGFDPLLDYDTLIHESRGRRVFVPSPEHSLLLLKATGKIPHGGGRKLDPDSDEYQVVRRWISRGAPLGDPSAVTVARLRLFPEHRIMNRARVQQLAVVAEYSDGTLEDVTRRAQYESNDQEVAGVDGEGLVRTQNLSGESAVMIRYQGRVAVFRATVPLGENVPPYDFKEQTVVDRFTQQKWRELGLTPSELCTDAQFLRRASLNIAGTLPTPAEVAAFTADTDANKRAKLIDRLLDSGEYADLFAHKWADILRVGRRGQQERIYGTFALHGWLRDVIAADLPYDEFARALLGALGDETKSPPTVWYKELKQPEQMVDDTAQVFLGMRIACAQCHHHPYEKWSQDDYWGMAAFFGRLRRKIVLVPGVAIQNQDERRQALYISTTGGVTNKRTNQPAVMKPLDGTPVEVPSGADPRQTLLDWMVDAQNPYFARAVANRYWAHFLGRGIVDPIDDIRQTNPPSNPALLDALADDLIAHRFSLKHLIRTICNSRTYQLSATPNDGNRHDKHAYARYYPKRLNAEVLYDAVSHVVGSPARFNALPQDTHAPRRAIMLPDESFDSYFLDVFGRPQRLSACECERVNEANLAQVLHLLNSNEVQGRLSGPNARANQLVKDPRPDAEKVDELFLWAFAHQPRPDQRAAALAHLARHAADKKSAYEDLLWTLLNTKEFSFNQ